MVVPARISLVTLGVADVARATAFYEALGWSRSSHSVDGEVSFFATAGSVLAVYDVARLAHDVGSAESVVPPFTGVTLAINVDSEAEVDQVVAHARTAGAGAPKAPAKASWGGYVGYFADPDGHVWEVAHNPFLERGPDGRLQV